MVQGQMPWVTMQQGAFNPAMMQAAVAGNNPAMMQGLLAAFHQGQGTYTSAMMQSSQAVGLPVAPSQQPQPQQQEQPPHGGSDLGSAFQQCADSLSPTEKGYYSYLWEHAGHVNNALHGRAAFEFLSKSNLPRDILKRIWDLADWQKRHCLCWQEFVVTLKLISAAQKKQLVSLERVLENCSPTSMDCPEFDGLKSVAILQSSHPAAAASAPLDEFDLPPPSPVGGVESNAPAIAQAPQTTPATMSFEGTAALGNVALGGPMVPVAAASPRAPRAVPELELLGGQKAAPSVAMAPQDVGTAPASVDWATQWATNLADIGGGGASATQVPVASRPPDGIDTVPISSSMAAVAEAETQAALAVGLAVSTGSAWADFGGFSGAPAPAAPAVAPASSQPAPPTAVVSDETGGASWANFGGGDGSDDFGDFGGGVSGQPVAGASMVSVSGGGSRWANMSAFDDLLKEDDVLGGAIAKQGLEEAFAAEATTTALQPPAVAAAVEPASEPAQELQSWDGPQASGGDGDFFDFDAGTAAQAAGDADWGSFEAAARGSAAASAQPVPTTTGGMDDVLASGDDACLAPVAAAEPLDAQANDFAAFDDFGDFDGGGSVGASGLGGDVASLGNGAHSVVETDFFASAPRSPEPLATEATADAADKPGVATIAGANSWAAFDFEPRKEIGAMAVDAHAAPGPSRPGVNLFNAASEDFFAGASEDLFAGASEAAPAPLLSVAPDYAAAAPSGVPDVDCGAPPLESLAFDDDFGNWETSPAQPALTTTAENTTSSGVAAAEDTEWAAFSEPAPLTAPPAPLVPPNPLANSFALPNQDAFGQPGGAVQCGAGDKAPHGSAQSTTQRPFETAPNAAAPVTTPPAAVALSPAEEDARRLARNLAGLGLLEDAEQCQVNGETLRRLASAEARKKDAVDADDFEGAIQIRAEIKALTTELVPDMQVEAWRRLVAAGERSDGGLDATAERLRQQCQYLDDAASRAALCVAVGNFRTAFPPREQPNDLGQLPGLIQRQRRARQMARMLEAVSPASILSFLQVLLVCFGALAEVLTDCADRLHSLAVADWTPEDRELAIGADEFGSFLRALAGLRRVHWRLDLCAELWLPQGSNEDAAVLGTGDCLASGVDGLVAELAGEVPAAEAAKVQEIHRKASACVRDAKASWAEVESELAGLNRSFEHWEPRDCFEAGGGKCATQQQRTAPLCALCLLPAIPLGVLDLDSSQKGGCTVGAISAPWKGGLWHVTCANFWVWHGATSKHLKDLGMSDPFGQPS